MQAEETDGEVMGSEKASPESRVLRGDVLRGFNELWLAGGTGLSLAFSLAFVRCFYRKRIFPPD